jgi:hypothetical protein
MALDACVKVHFWHNWDKISRKLAYAIYINKKEKYLSYFTSFLTFCLAVSSMGRWRLIFIFPGAQQYTVLYLIPTVYLFIIDIKQKFPLIVFYKILAEKVFPFFALLLTKSRISPRIRSHMQKGFNPCIRGPDGVVWWKKTRGRKSRDRVPLNLTGRYRFVLPVALCAQRDILTRKLMPSVHALGLNYGPPTPVVACTVRQLLDFTKSIPPWQKQYCQMAEIIKQFCLCVISYYEEKQCK